MMEFATKIKVVSKREYEASQVKSGMPLPIGVVPNTGEGSHLGVVSIGDDKGKQVMDGDWIVYEPEVRFGSPMPSLWRRGEFASFGGFVRAELVGALMNLVRAYKSKNMLAFDQAVSLVDQLSCEN